MAKISAGLLWAFMLWISVGAHAQYHGYLPIQTGGCEQTTVTVASGSWGRYTVWQKDLDTVLVGYPPNLREIQVIDITCNIVYDYELSRPYWWIDRIHFSLIEVKSDGTYRYRVEA